jgi:hypothetical protein
MFKNIFTYGTAFGSLAGAFLFIYLQNYGSGQYTSLEVGYYLMQMLIIPVTGCVLLVKSIRRLSINSDAKTRTKPGNYIMASLMASLVMTGIVTLVFTYISHQYPGIIENAKAHDTTKIMEKKEEFFKSAAHVKSNIDFETWKETILSQYEISHHFRNHLMQYSSMFMLVSALMTLYFYSKDKKNKPQLSDADAH